jgi:aminocarboxymuconate-semialdehyde decarboxylase
MMGPSRLLVGTDYPFFPREQPVGATMKAMGYAPDDLEAMESRNCLRFLGLASPRAT